MSGIKSDSAEEYWEYMGHTKGGKGVDELGDWDWHIYTIDTMYKIAD